MACPVNCTNGIVLHRDGSNWHIFPVRSVITSGPLLGLMRPFLAH
jgi:hypothetical protein